MKIKPIRGVNWSKPARMWVARFQKHGRRYLVGYFVTQAAAAAALVTAKSEFEHSNKGRGF